MQYKGAYRRVHNNKKNGATGEKSKSEHNNPKREQENREKWSRKLRKKKEELERNNRE